MTLIELSQWRGRVVIGSAGHVRLTGDSVAPKHAEIVVTTNGARVPIQLLRPIEGKVTVRRHGRLLAVLTEWRLADGDVLIIGDRRITYRNLASRPEAGRTKGGPEWAQQTN